MSGNKTGTEGADPPIEGLVNIDELARERQGGRAEEPGGFVMDFAEAMGLEPTGANYSREPGEGEGAPPEEEAAPDDSGKSLAGAPEEADDAGAAEETGNNADGDGASEEEEASKASESGKAGGEKADPDPEEWMERRLGRQQRKHEREMANLRQQYEAQLQHLQQQPPTGDSPKEAAGEFPARKDFDSDEAWHQAMDAHMEGGKPPDAKRKSAASKEPAQKARELAEVRFQQSLWQLVQEGVELGGENGGEVYEEFATALRENRFALTKDTLYALAQAEDEKLVHATAKAMLANPRRAKLVMNRPTPRDRVTGMFELAAGPKAARKPAKAKTGNGRQKAPDQVPLRGRGDSKPRSAADLSTQEYIEMRTAQEAKKLESGESLFG